MLNRTEKEAIVEQLKGYIAKADALFLTNTVGIDANASVALRRKVRDAKGHVVVAKNTLFRKASEGTSCEALLKSLKGTNAVAFSFEDPAAVAKAIHETSKELELVTVNGGWFADKVLTKNEVIQLASLPSRDQMLATLLATFNAPASAFVRVLHAIKEQKEKVVA